MLSRENANNDFSANNEIPSMLEAVVPKHPEVHGGSGFGAATVQGLGCEPTLGAASGEGKSKRVSPIIIGSGRGLVCSGGVCKKGVCKVEAKRTKEKER